jgi:lysophospholipase L1-like esterase
VDAEGGTGYINNGTSNDPDFVRFAGRLKADVARYIPDIVIVDGGRNDRWSTGPDLIAAVTSYLTAVREAWPHAHLVVVLPTFADAKLDTALNDTRPYIREAADRVGASLIDPVKLRWFDNSVVRTRLLGPDGVHPNDAGHAWYAERLTAAMHGLDLSAPVASPSHDPEPSLATTP